MAIDAKITIDSNAEFRQNDLAEAQDQTQLTD